MRRERTRWNRALTVLLGVVVISTLSCSAIFTPPKTVDQGLAYADAAVTTSTHTVRLLVEAGTMNKAQGQIAFKVLTGASGAIDLGWEAVKARDFTRAEEFLALAQRLLTEVDGLVKQITR